MFNFIRKIFNKNQDKDLPSAGIHQVSKTMKETYNVPGHTPRIDSSLYIKNHNDIIVIQDSPCFICGVKNSTLNDSQKNILGAIQIETHHYLSEWSIANAVDWSVMRQLHPDFSDWNKIDPNDESTYFNFIDSAYNLMPLCDIHHRGVDHGIHAIEYSVWIAQKFVKSNFPFIPQGKSSELLLDDMN